MFRLKSRWGMFIAATAMIMLLAATQVGNALAAPGDLDSTFDADGRQTVDFGGEESANGLAVQGDGKVIVVGTAFGTASTDFAVARLTAAGQPDSTFSGDGKVTTDISGTNSSDAALAVAVQADGKIVVVGSSGGQLAVVRYTTAGVPDDDFGTGGIVTLTIGGGSSATGRAVVIAPDGKIVIAGSANNNFMVVRLLSGGGTDNTWDSDGQRTDDFDGMTDEANAVVLQANAVVVAGTAGYNSGNRFGLIRYTNNGTPDATFGDGGKVNTSFPGGSGTARGLIAQTDGKVVAGGQALSFADFDFTLVRYESDGDTDSTFGTGGIAQADFGGGTDVGNGMAYDSSTGAIILVGETFVGTQMNNFAIARFTSAGVLDTTFSGDGKLTTDFPTNNMDTAFKVSLAPGGKFVVAGRTYDDDPSAADMAVARYSAVDPTPTATATRTSPPGSTATATRTTPPGATATATPCPITFSDVHDTDFFYEPVRYMFCNGIISGYNDNTFRPFANTTRGQLSKIIVLAEGFQVLNPATPTFRDVPTGHTFYTFVETAVARNIISGYDVGGGQREFRPQLNVTRGQLSKIVVFAEGWTLVNPGTPTFLDVATTNPFYREIETAVDHGIISGYDVTGGREFRWANNATRGQISKIVYEAITEPAK